MNLRASDLNPPPIHRALPTALAGSIALHGAIAGVLALLLAAGGSGRGMPFEGDPIRATLASPAQTFVVPKQREATPLASPIPGPQAEPSPLPVPVTPRVKPTPAGTPQGRVTINDVEGDEPIEPALQTLLQQIYPGAVRAKPEFDVAPEGVYPMAALKQKRQMQLTVIAVVLEDGSVELAQGTYDDPLFAPSVRAALANAKAQPAVVDGKPRKSWTLLAFTFEYVGVLP